jgi:hypothetical protein
VAVQPGSVNQQRHGSSVASARLAKVPWDIRLRLQSGTEKGKIGLTEPWIAQLATSGRMEPSNKRQNLAKELDEYTDQWTFSGSFRTFRARRHAHWLCAPESQIAACAKTLPFACRPCGLVHICPF